MGAFSLWVEVQRGKTVRFINGRPAQARVREVTRMARDPEKGASRRGRPRKRRKKTSLPVDAGQVSVILAGSIVTIALLTSGVPRLAAETVAFPAAATISAIKTGEPVTNRAMADAIDATQSQGRFQPRRQAERGAWRHILSRRVTAEGDSDRGTILLRQSVRDMVEGLSRAPLDGHRWAHLAAALPSQSPNRSPSRPSNRLEAGEHGGGVSRSPGSRLDDVRLEALRLSFNLGAYKLDYLRWRLWTALALQDQLDDDLTVRIHRQLDYLWQVPEQRPLVVEFSVQPGGMAWVEAAFEGRPDVIRTVRLSRASAILGQLEGPG